MSNNNKLEANNLSYVLLNRLIELSEKNMIVNLKLAGLGRDQIKAIVGVGTQKVDKVIMQLNSLKKGN